MMSLAQAYNLLVASASAPGPDVVRLDAAPTWIATGGLGSGNGALMPPDPLEMPGVFNDAALAQAHPGFMTAFWQRHGCVL